MIFNIFKRLLNKKYKYYPRNKNALEKCISKEISIQGFNADLNCIDTSKIKSMAYLFWTSDFNEFNGDISNWDVSKVKSMRAMFEEAQFNGNISNWDVSKVIDISEMFLESQFTGDISKWNVDNVENLEDIFSKSKFNGDIWDWDLSNLTADSLKYINAWKNEHIHIYEKKILTQEIQCKIQPQLGKYKV